MTGRRRLSGSTLRNLPLPLLPPLLSLLLSLVASDGDGDGAVLSRVCRMIVSGMAEESGLVVVDVGAGVGVVVVGVVLVVFAGGVVSK